MDNKKPGGSRRVTVLIPKEISDRLDRYRDTRHLSRNAAASVLLDRALTTEGEGAAPPAPTNPEGI